MTYREIYEYGCLKLKASDIAEYKLDARLLLEYVCDTNMSFMYTNAESEVSAEKEEEYLLLIERRCKHVPLQHITGTQCFMGFDFAVSEDVLIPRQDTEVLVEVILKRLHDGMSILDMCTGSGCILLSLLKLSNDCIGCGVDLSPKALLIAKENANRLGLADRLADESLKFVESNMFDGVEVSYDIIVSNPPYIVTCEIDELMPEVRDHEPFMALNGHEDGLFFYRIIARKAGAHLNRGGLLALEIGNTQGREVSELLNAQGYVGTEVIKDLCGNDRVVIAYKSVK